MTQTDIQTDRQADRQADRQTGRQTDIQITFVFISKFMYLNARSNAMV